MRERYSGSDWIEATLKMELSPLGREVADVLGQVFRGIYHVEKQAKRVDWSDKYCIEFSYYASGGIALYDFEHLTALLVLCHDRMLRMEIVPNMRSLKLMFHMRTKREGGHISQRMPTLEAHIEGIRKNMGLGFAAGEGDAP